MASAAEILSGIKQGNGRSLARALTLVENELDCWHEILLGLEGNTGCKTIGITGPPGAGKSTLVNALISHFVSNKKRVAVLAIDPTSPFNFGSLLGDRIRMNAHFNDANVFIRSVATRGSLGGLSAKAIEMTDVLRAAGFDYVFVETVGVGQSEVEIAGLADVTVVVLVPESGDEVQFIKSGLMEIADVFVVNKADRDGADIFVSKLNKMLHERLAAIPLFKTSADKGTGVDKLAVYLSEQHSSGSERRLALLADKAYKLISHKRMADIDKSTLQEELQSASNQAGFSLYRFIEEKFTNS